MTVVAVASSRPRLEVRHRRPLALQSNRGSEEPKPMTWSNRFSLAPIRNLAGEALMGVTLRRLLPTRAPPTPLSRDCDHRARSCGPHSQPRRSHPEIGLGKLANTYEGER